MNLTEMKRRPLLERLVEAAMTVVHGHGWQGVTWAEDDKKALSESLGGVLEMSDLNCSVQNGVHEDFAHFMLDQMADFHACTTGDCPHVKNEDCAEYLVDQYQKERVGV